MAPIRDRGRRVLYIINSQDKRESTFKGEIATEGVGVRWLIDEGVGARNFALRLFTLNPKGYIARHTHPWEHEIYVLQGTAQVKAGDREAPLKAGDALLIPSQEPHEFKNPNTQPFIFLCAINGAHRGPE